MKENERRRFFGNAGRFCKVASLLCCAMTVQVVGMMPVASAETADHNSVLQTKKVTGIVKDEAGNPLIGVSVIVKGTSNGAITDLDGNFSVSVSDKDVLVFSYVGMVTREIKTEGINTLNVILEEDAASLEDIVVIGYGTVKKAICLEPYLLYQAKSFKSFLLQT